MPRRVLATADQADRARQRQAIGCLRDTLIRPATLKRYQAACDRFLAFLAEFEFRLPSSNALLDERVSAYIEHLWQNGDSKAWAGDVLSGLAHFIPSTRRQLLGSWRLHTAWARVELPARAPPLTLALAYALCHVFRSKKWTDSLVLLTLGFHTYARTGELFNAQVKDFDICPRTQRGVWSLPLSKGGQRQGAREILTVDDPWVAMLIKGYCAGKLPGDRLTLVSPAIQRQRFQEAAVQLGLPDGYRWYSVRRGGATHDFRASGNLNQVMMRGRWAEPRTARIYLTDGLAQLAEIRLSDQVLARLCNLAKQVRPGLNL